VTYKKTWVAKQKALAMEFGDWDKVNPSIPIKTIIAEIKNRLGYSVTYKKAWVAKQKALAMEFGD